VPGNVFTKFDFFTFFVFKLRARTGQTDRETDGRIIMSIIHIDTVMPAVECSGVVTGIFYS